MKFNSHISSLFLLGLLGQQACVEPIDVFPEGTPEATLEGTLIVEANITTADKNQRVLLSRMQRVESDSTVNVPEDRIFNANTPFLIRNGLQPDLEEGARIEVHASDGQMYAFEEKEPGLYESSVSFASRPGESYQLFITTTEGKEYVSNSIETPEYSAIDDIYAERILSDTGQEGIAIFVDSSVLSNTSPLLRYAFEETYKIIAPNWTPVEFEIISEGDPFNGIPPIVTTVPRAREERVCYRTDFSSGIALYNFEDNSSTRILRNQIRFLNRSNPIISHRYSILVKQFVISPEAFAFYENLKSFSTSESLFSQVQPGFIEGNISRIDGDDPVIGLFEVSSEISRRFYFNYSDFFPDEPLPPYFGDDFNCDRLLSPPLRDPELDGPPSPDGPCPQSLVPRIKLGLVEYVDVNSDPGICEGPYYVTPTLCGDCTLVGTNVIPEFWEE